MDQNIKMGLTIVVSIIIGLAAFRAIQNYIVMKQVESITTDMVVALNKSAEKSRQQIQRQRVESARVNALTQQRNLEANLLCAKNVDTNKCSCYDKRSGQVVNMSLKKCHGFVEQKHSGF